jgi:hypothetical protein
MKFEEALVHFRAGKRIRMVGGQWSDLKDFAVHLYAGWEVEQPQYNFIQAVEMMREGKRMKRAGSLIVFYVEHGMFDGTCEPNVADILATDWVEVL